MSDGRWHDLNELHRDLARTTDPKQRAGIMKSISLIKQETGQIRSMREKLIRAHKNRDWDEVKDIHEYVRTHPSYRRFGE